MPYFRASFTRIVTGLIAVMLALPTMAVELKDISFSAQPGNQVDIVLTTSEPVVDPVSFTTDNPARIAIDLPATTSALGRKHIPVSVGAARSISAIEAADRTRVVINLLESVPHEISVNGNDILLNLSAAEGSFEAGPAPVIEPVAQSQPAASAGGAKTVTSIDFHRGEQGVGRVEVTFSEPDVVMDMRQKGQKVVLDLLDVRLPEELQQILEVSDFATPVRTVETKTEDGVVRMLIDAVGQYDHLAYQADNLLTVEFREITQAEKEAKLKDQAIYDGDRLSLNFQDIEVRAVLQLLADFTGLNMVVSDTVNGRITLRLKNVPWDQAMDIILKTKGLSMRRNGNVVLVAPTEEVAAREKLELESQQQIEELAPLRSELMQVNYATASNLAALLKSEENKLLSDRGSVTVDQRTNTLLVQDTAAKLEEIRALLAKLDVPVRQVLIESRIVIANNDFAKDLGVRLGTTGRVRNGNHTALFGGGLAGYQNASGIGDQAISDEDGNQTLLVNLPQTLAAGSGGAANFVVGRLGSYLLSLELSAMQQEGKGEIISSPRVITSDQTQAIIKQGIEIPYQEASSSGSTSVSFKEAVLQLDVTPHITPDDRVVMDLKVNKDNPDFTRSVLGVPPVDTRELQTTVLVDNGETVVLGGVFERTKSNTISKVPLFGDLPYVGFMFKQRQQQDENSELLIFVTPKILKDTLTLE